VLVNGVAGRPDAADVVYLGVRPARRRRGFGRAMIRKALHAAAGEGVAEMHLAVDAENDAAFALYRQEGFVEIDRKDVYIRVRGPGGR
jgi:ribosomal-protein-alanine N-acetyltransferase